MTEIRVGYCGQVVSITVPPSLLNDVLAMFGALRVADSTPRHVVAVEGGQGCYRVSLDGIPVREDLGGVASVKALSRTDALSALTDQVTRALITNIRDGVVLHAGAVSKGDRAILVAGPSGFGKSSMVAWLAHRGFGYLADDVVRIDRNGDVTPLRRPLMVKPGSTRPVCRLEGLRAWNRRRFGSNLALSPDWTPPQAAAKGCLILFPRFEAESSLALTPLSAAQTGLRLMACNLNARNLKDWGLPATKALANSMPGLELRYGHYRQLEGPLDLLADMAASGRPALRELLQAFGDTAPAPLVRMPAAPSACPIPAPTLRREKKKLTIGMATYDDFDGVYFSLQSLRMFHPEILADTEFLVMDNHPDGRCAEGLKKLENSIPNYRYVPKFSHSGTAIRDFVFAEASGDYVLCLDCHVLIVQGAVKRLLDYFDRYPRTDDLLQGPLLYDDLQTTATRFVPEWAKGMYGHFARDPVPQDPESEPFEIVMQGLGLFACRRAAWPGFNPDFRSFGGEEGYIHEKVRQRGSRTVCLPFLRWVHRFHRPMGVPYPINWEDRIRNYVIGFREVGLDTDQVERHFTELLGSIVTDPLFRELRREMSADKKAPDRRSARWGGVAADHEQL